MNFFSKLLDYLFYRKCYICSKKCVDISLCNNCLDKIFSNLKFSDFKKFNTKIYTGAIYENDLLKIIRALKYHKKKEFEKILADIIIETIKHYNLDLKDFVICPVPIHKNRYKKRGYNHMELVAKNISDEHNIELQTDLLQRIKDTQALYKLSATEREMMIKGAFIASDNIKDKKILLLDDIITTGATIKELSKIIFEKGAKELIVICATRSNNLNF